ncbi:hypothetical protein AAVH_39651, partial [Aphelenchoides avenae]
MSAELLNFLDNSEARQEAHLLDFIDIAAPVAEPLLAENGRGSTSFLAGDSLQARAAMLTGERKIDFLIESRERIRAALIKTEQQTIL